MPLLSRGIQNSTSLGPAEGARAGRQHSHSWEMCPRGAGDPLAASAGAGSAFPPCAPKTPLLPILPYHVIYKSPQQVSPLCFQCPAALQGGKGLSELLEHPPRSQRHLHFLTPLLASFAPMQPTAEEPPPPLSNTHLSEARLQG